MLRFVIRLVAVALLFAVPSAQAITDMGRPEVTRLFNENGFACTGSYVFPFIEQDVSYIITAGHCITLGNVSYARRNLSETTSALVNWRIVVNSSPARGGKWNDLAIGTAPDTRRGVGKKFWLADTMGDEPDVVYIHGFPAGVEMITVGRLGGWLDGARIAIVPRGSIIGGYSGSPVLNRSDRVVGILWGGIEHSKVPLVIPGLQLPDELDLALITPIDEVHRAFKIIGETKSGGV